MKNDPTFKIAAAVILAGLITAFVSPGQATPPKETVAATTATAPAHADATE